MLDRTKRVKIVILGSLLLLVSFLLVLRLLPSPPAVIFSFTGYSKDGHWALFSLTNQTGRYIDHSHARIQLATPNGWSNYYDMEEMMMIRDIGPLYRHSETTLSAALPKEHHRWRALVRYSVMPDYDFPLRMRIQRMLNFLHLDSSTNETTIFTGEYER